MLVQDRGAHEEPLLPGDGRGRLPPRAGRRARAGDGGGAGNVRAPRLYARLCVRGKRAHGQL